MTWKKVKALVPEKINRVLVPIGTIEAHGAAALGGLLSTLTMLLYNAVFGILAGGLVLAVVRLIGRLRGERSE